MNNNGNGERQETIERRNISMYDEWAVVDAISKDYGLNTSASVRFIVNDWARMKARESGVNLKEA